MAIKRIVNNASTYQNRNFNPKTSMDRPLLTIPAMKGVPTDPAMAVSAYRTNIKDPDNNKHQTKQPLAVADGSSSKPDGVVSHVVVSYNHQGTLRTRFEDSRNHLVYHMPLEMAARMDDLMLANSFTDVKG